MQRVGRLWNVLGFELYSCLFGQLYILIVQLSDINLGRALRLRLYHALGLDLRFVLLRFCHHSSSYQLLANLLQSLSVLLLRHLILQPLLNLPLVVESLLANFQILERLPFLKVCLHLTVVVFDAIQALEKLHQEVLVFLALAVFVDQGADVPPSGVLLGVVEYALEREARDFFLLLAAILNNGVTESR